ncbi:hypothetical protein VTN77DRAFT_8074 [Rasamsonia byssochlamydoides]|uniref:uncharacterized protein n=1 Tax=Rasamsonia byssochlamydoides TaxID=89139 RepID=UPI003744451B
MDIPTTVLRQSGSSWDARKLKYFRIEEMPLVEDIFPGILSDYLDFKKLDGRVRSQLIGLGSDKLSLSRHSVVINEGGLLGPFLASLAVVKERRDLPDSTASPRPQRAKTTTTREGYVSSTTIGSPGSTPERKHEVVLEPGSGSSYHPSTTDTDASAHERRAKPEIATNVMAYLFLQASL